MKKRNVIIGILGILLVGALIWGYKSNKTTIDNKIATTSENAKVEISDITVSIERKVKTNYALTKVKVALLKSQIALEIDKSEQKAEAALDDAISFLFEARSTADEKTKTEIDLLKDKANTAKKSIVQKNDSALKNLSDASAEAKALSEKYYDELQAEKEKNVAATNRKNAELRAEEALLKAKIAVQSEETYAQAQVYLEEANEWYIRSKEYGTMKIKSDIKEIQNDIEDAQVFLKKKDEEVREKIDEIIQKAKELIEED